MITKYVIINLRKRKERFMASNLIINVRCTCEEEYLVLQKIHRLYQEDKMQRKVMRQKIKDAGISSMILGSNADDGQENA